MSTANGSPRRSGDLYKESGVDVAKGDALVDWLQSGKNESRPLKGQVVSGIGGFAGLFRPNFKGMEDPLLVSGTDGVGTKVLLGIETGQLEGLGIDLVAMCVNDLYTLGARPLFFLDYYATGSLREDQFKAVLTGIKRGCAQSQSALLGGETAEMPGLYEAGHFDLAGFIVGIVDGKKVLGPERVKVGDRLYSLPSSGFHSNGYSLLRHWLKETKTQITSDTWQRLMEPTRIYHELPDLIDKLGTETIHALANITGGGISGNLPRVMPKGVKCCIEKETLPIPDWMSEFICLHGAKPLELEGVLNLGVGMIAAVAKEAAGSFEKACVEAGLAVKAIGEVRPGVQDQEAEVVYV